MSTSIFSDNEALEQWVDTIWQKVERKLSRTAPSVGDGLFPYTTTDGKFTNPYDKELPYWWTDGFWVGILWKMYEATGNSMYQEYANRLEDKLDAVIEDFQTLHHDVGFMWLLSSVANYRLTGNQKSKIRGLHMASTLAGRFNINGNYIRAWNSNPDGSGDNSGLAIIDSMMNIPLLYWATKETKDPRFKSIAMRHADTLMEYAIRPDGSVKHIMEFHPETGEYIGNVTGQSFAVDASWTRGQSWALYGFTLSYIHTGKQEYLDTAKKVAHYFIANLAEDPVPPCDFRSPEEPAYKDTTAGMCAACGLLELANIVPEYEKKLYRNAALRILKATEERYCDWSDTEDSIVQYGTEAYHFGEKNIPIIYADYYFIEAILKLKGDSTLFW